MSSILLDKHEFLILALLRSLVAVCLVAGLPVVLVFLAAVSFSSVFPGPWGLVALRSLGLVFSPPWSLVPALVFGPAPSVLGGWCWAGPLLSAVAGGASFAPGLFARDLVGGLALPFWFCVVLFCLCLALFLNVEKSLAIRFVYRAYESLR